MNLNLHPIFHVMKTSLLLLFVIALVHTAAAQQPSSYGYDLNNRVTLVNYPDGRQAAITYDEMGNILSIVNRNAAPAIIIVGQPLLLTAGTAMVDYSITLSRTAVVKSYAVKNLPPGLKANLTAKVNSDGRNPGVIYGTPTTSGSFRVELSATTTLGATPPANLMMHVSNPFSQTMDGYSLAGQFSGVIDPSALSGSLGGTLVIKTTTSGTFTGTLTLGSVKYSISGRFDGTTGVAAPITIIRKAPFVTNLTLALTMDLSATSATRGGITGTLSDGGPPEPVAAFREVWSKTLPAAYFADVKGSVYNTALFIDSAHLNDDGYPQGVSYARITTDQLGKAAVAGKLADGTGITGSAIIWPDGQVPLFLPLYTSKGSLVGTLQLGTGFAEDLVVDNDITGSLDWKRPAITGKLYSTGFTTRVDATGGVYAAPVKGSRVLDLGSAASHATVVLNLMKGGLSGTVSANLTVSTANLVTGITPNNNTIKITFTPATGLMAGEFAVGVRKAKLEGLILPANPLNDSEAYGFFLLPGAAAADPTLSGFVFIGRP